MANILIIDDDQMLCETLCRQVRYMEHSGSFALSISQGFEKLDKDRYDVVFLDVRLPDGNGLDALPKIKGLDYSPEIIIITGEGDPDGAELAIRSGAWDYIEKPLSVKKISLQLMRTLSYRSEKLANQPLVALRRKGLVGDSNEMRKCLEFVVKASQSAANVLITGETGTGKELICRAIHENSERAERNLVIVDCAAMPENLVESTLFGHVRGAFTGADKAQDGLIRQADGGTLFLDEIGELPLSIQKAFLRVLQERNFRPVGGKHEIKSNFRMVAATNRDLDDLSKKGEFREDLYYRIKSLSFHMAPLRKHVDDIRDIVLYHMSTICKRDNMETKGISPDFFEALEAYSWPGNVRELVNALETVLMNSRETPTLFARNLPVQIRIHAARTAFSNEKTADAPIEIENESADNLPSLKEYKSSRIGDIEKHYLIRLLSKTGKDIHSACRISGLSRSRLYELMKKNNLSFSE